MDNSRFNPDQIVRDYRRNQLGLNPDNDAVDIETLASEMCDELILQVSKEAEFNTRKAIIFKALDNVFYITTHLIALAICILGLYNGGVDSNNDSNGVDTASKWFYAISILSLIGALLNEIWKRYDFKQRSIAIYSCAQDFISIVTDLRELKVSPILANAKMDQIKAIEIKLKSIQMKTFNNQIIKTTLPTEIVTS